MKRRVLRERVLTGQWIKKTRPSLCPRSICNVPHSSLSPPERYSITPLSLIFLAQRPGQLPSITQMYHAGTPSARLLPPATNLSAKHDERQRSKSTSLQQEVHIWHSLGALSWYWTPPDMGRRADHLTVLTPEWLNQVPNPTILFYAMTTQTSCHSPHSRKVKFQCRITNKYHNKDKKNMQSHLGNVPKRFPASSDLMFWNIKITTNKCKKRTPTHIGLIMML